MASILAIAPLPVPVIAPPLAPAPPTGDFSNVLAASIHRVEATRTAANQAVEKFLTGESEELHTAALATQRAEISMELFLQVRNKVVSAYQEVMRMQV